MFVFCFLERISNECSSSGFAILTHRDLEFVILCILKSINRNVKWGLSAIIPEGGGSERNPTIFYRRFWCFVFSVELQTRGIICDDPRGGCLACIETRILCRGFLVFVFYVEFQTSLNSP